MGDEVVFESTHDGVGRWPYGCSGRPFDRSQARYSLVADVKHTGVLENGSRSHGEGMKRRTCMEKPEESCVNSLRSVE